MAVQTDGPAEEIKRLRRCINDLVSLLALPATWTGSEPSRIVSDLMGALLNMLSLDFVYARLRNLAGEDLELVRTATEWEPKPGAQALGEILRPWLRNDTQNWPDPVRGTLEGREMSVVPLPLGVQGETGIVIAGSSRVDFPQQTEKLVLSVAANQAAIGLQEASLLSELDQRVAERTSELAAANEELRREISDRKRAEEALRNTQAELARVMRVMTMGQLTASIAHEVSQPLSGIVTNASTCVRMLDANPPNLEGARETARRTIRDGNRASDVITRLRTLYSKKDLVPEPMDLNEATREVISLSLSELQRNRVVLRQELAEDLPPIMGDRIQIQQVILNLIRNGSDAMNTVDERPGELLIRTETDEGVGVRLSVKDTGEGFDPQTEDKLFEAFYSTKEDGMGIGLSVSRSIRESHRGRLWAIRNEGPGATFLFSIPCGGNTQVQ